MSAPPKSFNVSLSPELTSLIASRVASGQCRSASEAVQAALRLLKRDEEVDLLFEGLPTQPNSKSGQAADA